MDKKKLEDKLSAIAEWTYPCLSDATSTEYIIPTDGSKVYKQKFTPKPDLGPRIIRFKPGITLRPCEWCGKILNQKQNITKQTIPARRGINPEMVKWHHSCYNCHRVWDPHLGQLQPVSKSLIAKRNKNKNK